MKRIQPGFQIRNSHTNLTGRNLYSCVLGEVRSSASPLVFCDVWLWDSSKSLCDHVVIGFCLDGWVGLWFFLLLFQIKVQICHSCVGGWFFPSVVPPYL